MLLFYVDCFGPQFFWRHPSGIWRSDWNCYLRARHEKAHWKLFKWLMSHVIRGLPTCRTCKSFSLDLPIQGVGAHGHCVLGPEERGLWGCSEFSIDVYISLVVRVQYLPELRVLLFHYLYCNLPVFCRSMKWTVTWSVRVGQRIWRPECFLQPILPISVSCPYGSLLSEIPGASNSWGLGYRIFVVASWQLPQVSVTLVLFSSTL